MLLRLWAGAAVLASAGGARHKHASSRSQINVAVVRQSGHSGSNWLANMLAEAGFATAFQWDGLCLSTRDYGIVHRDRAIAANLSLSAILEVFAAPPRCGMMRTTEAVHCSLVNRDRCAAYPVCTDRRPDVCPVVPAQYRRLRGIAMVAPFGTTMAPAFAPHLFHAGVRLVAWIRDNHVKHAFSVLKGDHCPQNYAVNHVSAHCAEERDKFSICKTVDAKSPLKLIWADPRALLAKATALALERSNFEQRILARDGHLYAHVTHYEDWQLDKNAELAKLLRAVGAEGAPADDVAGAIIKATPERVDAYLQNFNEVDKLFKNESKCLRKMLNSESAERFDLCDDVDKAKSHATLLDDPEGLLCSSQTQTYASSVDARICRHALEQANAPDVWMCRLRMEDP